MRDSFLSSRDVIVHTGAFADAVLFYERVLGLQVAEQTESLVGFETGSFRLYIAKGEGPGPVFEFLVPDLRNAKERLVAAGCRVEIEDSTVPRCYIRDPFGLTFNLAQRG